MNVARFDPSVHLETLSAWLKHDGVQSGAGSAGLYPRTGFVVDDIAMGFLYRTDAPLVGFIDGVITNPRPQLRPRERHEAIRILVDALVAEADASGIKFLWAYPSTAGLASIGRRCGFIVYDSGHFCLARVKETSPCL